MEWAFSHTDVIHFQIVKSLSNLICLYIGLKMYIATQRVYKCFPIFSLSTYRVFFFTCKSLIHLEFILVDEVS